MKKRYFTLFLFCLFGFLQFQRSFAQNVRYKIAIFSPLYLDSAFDDLNNYRYEKQFPKFINPGLEFYEGVQLALDSLAKEGTPLEVFIYDTRSGKEPLAQQLNKLDSSIELILAYANPQESWNIANAAKSKKIPYVNINLPNDAGITDNPYFVMLNSTLQTHIGLLYKYLQKNYALAPIIMFRKKGQMEDMVKSLFDDAGKNTVSVPLKIKYVDLVDSFTVDQLTAKLDSNKHTVCIAGSLDENFGRRLSQQLASIGKSYPLTLVGMPTFDNLTKDFTSPQYKGLEIVYSTPFYNSRMDKVSQGITDYFNTKMYARPSDMVMRGYEATWRFSKLLLEYGKDIASNLSRKEFNLFRELDIQPVINKQTTTLDYFENKKLFFVKWQDGIIKGVN
ncbi:MAG TPA: amino acid ABC transporter substrate-binding protein [Chitinophagaceae bacterium]|jgi:ABC-type branched-subunit amino acid transport system substrate-binding protein|nr:amino acid ABC transporter substrate-binding protein [Chitinophagaceae bacterium]